MAQPQLNFREGEPFVFVSYAHEDADKVFPEMEALSAAGFNIWYDEGISPGASWRDEVAHAIEDCKTFLFFITNNSLNSQHCLQEINFALENDRHMLAVYLDEIELSGGIAMSLLDKQLIHKQKYGAAEYEDKLHEALRQSIEPGTPSSAQRPTATPTTKSGTPFKLGLGVVALIAIGIAYYLNTQEDLTEADIIVEYEESVVRTGASIAVLPFVNLTGEQDQFFGDGIAEEVLNRLTRINDLKVISRVSSFNMRNSTLPAPEIGSQLGAEFLLEGSIRRTGDDVRVTAQLIQAAEDKQVWSETYDAPLDDLFSIQDKIAQGIVYKIKRKVADAATFNTPPPTSVMSAYDAWLIAMTLKHSAQEPEAIRHFERALELDPNFAEVHLGLSWSYWQLIVKQGIRPELLRQQVDYAEKGYALKPESAQITGALCRARMVEGRWVDSERLCLEALQINPRMVSVVRTYSWLMLTTGRKAEYIRAAEGNDLNWERYMTAQYYLHTEQWDKLKELGLQALDDGQITTLRFAVYGALANKDREFMIQGVAQATGEPFEDTGEEWQALNARILQQLEDKEVAVDPHIWIALETQAGHLDKVFNELLPAAVPFFVVENPAMQPAMEDPRWQSYLEKLQIDDASNEKWLAASAKAKQEMAYIDPWY